jgi:hypothetical protein
MSDIQEIEEEDRAHRELEGDIKSSGETRQFESGAQRDSNTKILKGRMDLVPGVAMNRFAEFFTDESTNPHSMGPRHALASYNDAMESLYLWLEGKRTERDGGRFHYDHLSAALMNCQEIMHIELDIPMWYPTMAPDYDYTGLRYDCISPEFTRRVSIHYQKGGINYGDRNWELGMPAMVTWDSATRHMTNWLERLPEDKEDHMAAFGWNIMCTMHTIEMVRRGIFKEHMYQPPMHTADDEPKDEPTVHNENGVARFVMGTEDDGTKWCAPRDILMGRIKNMIQPSCPWPR